MLLDFMSIELSYKSGRNLCSSRALEFTNNPLEKAKSLAHEFN